MSKQTKVNRRTVMAEANALVKSANMNRSDAVKQGYKIARENGIPLNCLEAEDFSR